MKNKYLFLIIFIVFISACYTPSYLPKPETINENQFGSYIKITDLAGNKYKGELIAVENNTLYVLHKEYDTTLLKINISNIFKYRIMYAKGKNYWWLIPIFSLSPSIPMPDPNPKGSVISFHGFFAFLTVPLNLIVTSLVSISSFYAFTYTQDKISYEQLKMFARFPAGIPKNIKLEKIK